MDIYMISAIDLHMQYKYTYWDSLSIATALEHGCKTLLSEDLQSGQLIEKKLKIVSPYPADKGNNLQDVVDFEQKQK